MSLYDQKTGSTPPAITAAERFASLLLYVSGAAIVVVAAAGTADAVLSVIGSRPIPGVFELTELALVLIIFMAQPFIILTGSHIALDLVAMPAGSLMNKLRDVLTLLLGLLCYGVIAWTATQGFLESLAVRQATDGIVGIPVYPFKFMLAFGAAVTVVVIVLMLIFRRFGDAANTNMKIGEI